MFVHIAVHHPKPEYTEAVLASMRRVDDRAQGSPGLIQIGAWTDHRSGRLVGLALWEDRAAYEAAAPEIFAVIADDPFDQWCTQPPDVFHLVQP